MIAQLEGILNLVTSSLVLFSSIGIFVLTLNARYTHAIARVRELYDEIKAGHQDAKKLQKELNLMVFRCHLLKWSFALLLSSAISSGAFLLCSIFSRFLNISPEILLSCLIFSVLFIFSSMVLLFRDVLVSLKATLIHIEHIKS